MVDLAACTGSQEASAAVAAVVVAAVEGKEKVAEDSWIRELEAVYTAQEVAFAEPAASCAVASVRTVD